MWARFYKSPRKCSKIPFKNWTAKQVYYREKSYERYLNTYDGMTIMEIERRVRKAKQLFGKIDSFRIIETKE